MKNRRPPIWVVLLCAIVVLMSTSVETLHFHTHSAKTQPLSKKTNGTCLICHTPSTFLTATFAVTHGTSFVVQGSPVPFIAENRTNSSVFHLYIRPPPNPAC